MPEYNPIECVGTTDSGVEVNIFHGTGTMCIEIRHMNAVVLPADQVPRLMILLSLAHEKATREDRETPAFRSSPPDHSNLGCLCSLESQHPPTAWGHLQPRTMGDPCPICGGTEYYCAEMIDHVLSRDSASFDTMMRAVADLYEEYCQAQRKEPGRGQVKYHLARLMDAYNRWLG